MPEGPKLDLPQYQPVVTSRGGGAGAIVVVLLIAILGLQAWSLYRTSRPPSAAVEPTQHVDPDLEKRLAMKLEERNLPGPAVRAWQRYLAAAGLEAAEAGRIYYRIGRLHQQDEQYDTAIADFYRAETLLGDAAGDLGQKITMRIRECLRKRGQYVDLSRELAERSRSDGPAQPGDHQIVAQIGDEQITLADFDRLLTEQIEQSISMNPGLTEQQADELRQEAAARLADPSARIQQLQQIIVNRVAAAEARSRGLDQADAFRRRLADLADNLLAGQLILDEVTGHAAVTPEDIERFYKANADAYSEPTQVTIAHILVETEAQAKDLMAKIESGETFETLARAESLDAETKDNGGRIDQRVAEAGDYVPNVGSNAALHAAIMGAAEGSILATPYRSEHGWHVIKILKREPGRVLPFEEVREEVAHDTRSARRQEVARQFVQELFEKHRVKLYPQVLTAQAKGTQPDE